MTSTLIFRVIGAPGPQGSKSAIVRGGRAIMREASKKVRPWRQDVVDAAHAAAVAEGWTPPAEAFVTVTFWFRRPKTHYGTGRNAGVLKANAPTYHRGKPDVDKLQRSTFDALTTAAVITDDATVVHVIATKRYAGAGQPTGATIRIHPHPEGEAE